MKIFKETNKWVRHKYTQLLLDDAGMVHVGKSARLAGLAKVVADVVMSLCDNDYVLIDFTQCPLPLISSIRYTSEHIFLSETSAVFFTKLLKCMLSRPAELDLYTIRGDLLTNGVVMDSPEMRVVLRNEEVQVESHTLISTAEHLTQICGCISSKGRMSPLWLVSEPEMVDVKDAVIINLIQEDEVAESAQQEPEPADAEDKSFDNCPPGIPEEVPPRLTTEATDSLGSSHIEELSTPPDTAASSKPKSSLYENFVYQPRTVVPAAFEELSWGGVKMVRFNTKVTSEDLLRQVFQVDIYHFAKGVNANLVMPLLNNGFALFTGKENTIWTGKTLIKRELLETLGEGFQKVKYRKNDSSPRIIPAVAQGPVIQA